MEEAVALIIRCIKNSVVMSVNANLHALHKANSDHLYYMFFLLVIQKQKIWYCHPFPDFILTFLLFCFLIQPCVSTTIFPPHRSSITEWQRWRPLLSRPTGGAGGWRWRRWLKTCCVRLFCLAGAPSSSCWKEKASTPTCAQVRSVSVKCIFCWGETIGQQELTKTQTPEC